MAKYKTGDKVWCLFNRPDIGIWSKKYAGIVLGETPGYLQLPPPFNMYDIDVPELEPENNETCWHGQEIYLTPRHDPYDGDKAGDWDSVPWKPEMVTI